jgi:hypothetical protein
MRFRPASFRSTFSRVLTIVVLLVAASALVGLVATGDLGSVLRSSAWFVLLGSAGFVLFWMPRVDVLEHEVTVRNPFSTWHIAWPAIERIDTKWALTLYTAGARIEAWSAPASGRFTVFQLGPDDTRVSESGRLAGTIRPGDTLSSDSGAAAQHIRRHWEELRDDGLLEGPLNPGAVRRDYHRGTIALTLGLCALGLAGAVL